VELILTAGIIEEITQNVLVLECKKGDFYAGLDKGLGTVFQLLNRAYKGVRKQVVSRANAKAIFFFVRMIFFCSYVFTNKKNKSGGRGFRGGFFTDTIFTAVI
jgi:uncharacterized protein